MSEGRITTHVELGKRFETIWKLYGDGYDDSAEIAAENLLQEPGLGKFYRAIRLYTEISERNDLTETERQEVTGYLEEAKRLLDIAHQDEEA
ncbi:hypothetical protein ACLX1H_010852 [Fusarium chlamydosporum]